MKVWVLKLIREGEPDVYVFYRADKLPELITAAWLVQHQSAIRKTKGTYHDAVYKFVNGPMVYLRSLGK